MPGSQSQAARAKRGSSAGQSLVELALMFTFLMILLAGVLDFGRMYYVYLALQSSAQEGAVFVCSSPTCVDSTDCPDPNNMEYRLRHESEVGLIDWSAVGIGVSPNSPGNGDVAKVDVTYDFFMAAPFVSAMAPDGLTLTGSATCRVIGQ